MEWKACRTPACVQAAQGLKGKCVESRLNGGAKDGRAAGKLVDQLPKPVKNQLKLTDR